MHMHMDTQQIFCSLALICHFKSLTQFNKREEK